MQEKCQTAQEKLHIPWGLMVILITVITILLWEMLYWSLMK
jgi:hypothetical protein